MRRVYRVYCERLMARLAVLLSRDPSGAYNYLPQSVLTFDSHDSLAQRLGRVGFRDGSVRTMNFGTVALHRAEKRPSQVIPTVASKAVVLDRARTRQPRWSELEQ